MNPKAQQRKIKQNNKEDTLEQTTPFSQNIIVFYFVNMRVRNGMHDCNHGTWIAEAGELYI